jgi:adenylate cyclase
MSYTELLQSGQLENQLVLVGPTASVFQDLHRTPFSGAEGMPGVELHATELANRLEGRALWQWQPGREWALVLGLLALLAGWLGERWQVPLQRLAVLSAIAMGIGFLGLISVGLWGIAPNLFSSAAVILMMAVVSTGDATVRLQLQRQRLRMALGRYLSPAVAAEIASQPREADQVLGGRTAEVAVLIADIRGFTDRTRRMSAAGNARELVQQLNEYFTDVVEAVHHEAGTVDKFIGDAVLAIFGAPLSRGREAEAAAALRTALDIQRRLNMLNQRWIKQGKEPWQQVIVLNFGTVISGNIGSKTRMDYTAIGDAVNAASRLEAVAKASGRDLVMSGAFIELLDPEVSLVPLGEFELRGFAKVPVYGLGTDQATMTTDIS